MARRLSVAHRAIVAFVLLTALSARAAVTRFEVIERGDIAFAGYERILGKLYFALDPQLAANRKLADIGRAPRNARGLVEFSSDVLIYQPKQAHSNGTGLFEIPNRGGVTNITAFQDNAEGRGVSPKDLGDLFLFKQGFTLIWIGWQFDEPPGPGRIRLFAPVLRGVTGPVRSEIIVDRRAMSASLADRNMIPYAVADPDKARLTVRDGPAGPRIDIPRAKWRFSADLKRVEYGFEPGRIYEVVYTGKDPVVASLGLAAVRDGSAYLRESLKLQRTLGYGMSQSGRFLRTFLYDRFNADEQGHRVFDGMWVHISGAGRGNFNQRFGQPSRSTAQYAGFSYPTDLPPYTPQQLLEAARQAGVAPKLMLTNGSHEYWGRAASLNHAIANRDLDLGPDVRAYFVAGTQHTPAANPRAVLGLTQQLANPMEWRYFLRAMLMAMQAWIAEGKEPPASQLPAVAKNELVSIAQWRFPKLPGVATPRQAYAPQQLDFGPRFLTEGIAEWEPPKVGAPFPVLVPQVNSDGNETSGILLPELRVPLATYTGWNLRDPRSGAPQGAYPLLGAMIPFPKTRAERERTRDPRRSIAERYAGVEDYLKRVQNAAQELVPRGFLLAEDVPAVVNRARVRWNELTAPPRK